MERKFIHWIKDNCWIIAGILLAGNIIYVYFSDKYYFYNSQNVRYTIAKYKDTNFLVGKNPKIQYFQTCFYIAGIIFSGICVCTIGVSGIRDLPFVLKNQLLLYHLVKNLNLNLIM